MTNDRLYLDDILEAIERIERYTAAGQEALLRDELVQTWVVHHIQTSAKRYEPDPLT